MQLLQGPLEPAAPWEPALIKYNGSVIVIGNHSKWAPGCGWEKSGRRRREGTGAGEGGAQRGTAWVAGKIFGYFYI